MRQLVSNALNLSRCQLPEVKEDPEKRKELLESIKKAKDVSTFSLQPPLLTIHIAGVPANVRVRLSSQQDICCR